MIMLGQRLVRGHVLPRLYAVLPAALVVLSGCARASGPGDARASAAQRAASTVITQEEIRTAGAATAYDLIQSLRPRWLNKRGPQTLTDVTLANPPSEGDVIVYLAVARLGGLNALREIAASSLVSIEFLDAPKANYRFGRGHPYGAIILNTASQ